MGKTSLTDLTLDLPIVHFLLPLVFTGCRLAIFFSGTNSSHGTCRTHTGDIEAELLMLELVSSLLGIYQSPMELMNSRVSPWNKTTSRIIMTTDTAGQETRAVTDPSFGITGSRPIVLVTLQELQNRQRGRIRMVTGSLPKPFEAMASRTKSVESDTR
jgi:hypothetical protein